MGVLLAAILRALAAIDAGPVGLEPGHVGLPGNELNLAAEARDPERVDDVFAVEGEAHRLSDRNVDLVRGHEDLRGIVVLIDELPPPLMASDLDRQSRLRRRIGDSAPSSLKSRRPSRPARPSRGRRRSKSIPSPRFPRAECRRRRRLARAAKSRSGPAPR